MYVCMYVCMVITVDKTDTDMREFAVEGLRCLLISYAALDSQVGIPLCMYVCM